jgi:hypothetical protein
MDAKSHICSLLSETELYKRFQRTSIVILTSLFGIIAQMCLSLRHNKWYQNNIITSCGVGALRYDVGFDEDVRDLSGKNCDTPKS